MAEWLALQIGKCGYPSSIPPGAKHFLNIFFEESSLKQCHVELNSNLMGPVPPYLFFSLSFVQHVR